jgi:hypothetical protein
MVVGILVVVGGINFGIWYPIIRKLRRMPDELTAELTAAGENIVRGPERVAYSGSTHSRVRGISIIALTDRRLVIRKAIGKPVEVATKDIVSVRTDKWFLSARSGRRTHVIVKTTDGAELGFIALDPEAWLQALRPAA